MGHMDIEELRTCKHCDAPAIYLYTRWLCPMHHRFRQMRADALKGGKIVPSMADLIAMTRNFVCVDCGVALNWFAKDGKRTVATLQHYRDGTLGIVCFSCNARHGAMPGDTFRDLPDGHKWCAKCSQVKPCGEFHADRSSGRLLKLRGSCKACSEIARSKWYARNVEHCNELRRKRYK
jgi:hypothetical protein